MFLTTNHIATFDVAIPSRVHVAIRYESLNKRQQEAIFRGFLGKLDENAIEDYDDIYSGLSGLCAPPDKTGGVWVLSGL